MKIRVKSKWNKKDKDRSPTEIGSALAFNLWKIAGANVLHIENEGFQTETQHQRLDIIAELLAFFVHIIDRMVSEKEYAEKDRADLITAVALSLAKTMHDNRRDIESEGDFKEAFINLLNERMGQYAEFSYENGEPGFQLRRRCGDYVSDVMGEVDKKWVTSQIMDIELPDALKTFKKVARSLL